MRTRLSASYAILGQGLLLFIFTPLNVLLWTIVFRSNFSTSTILFALFFAGLSVLIVFLGFKTADVSIENGVLFISKLFWTTKVPSQQYRKIGTLLPFGYYLEFENGKKVYVLFGPDEIIKQFTSSKPNEFIDEIKSLINKGAHV
jgi:hypothetical protein